MESLTYLDLLNALVELNAEQLQSKVRLIGNANESILLDTVLDCELKNSYYSHYPLNVDTFKIEGNTPLLIIHQVGF